MDKKHAVFGIFRSKEEVEKAVKSLKSEGFNPSNVSVLYPEHYGSQNFAYELHTMIRPGAVVGAVLGAITGAILSFFLFSGIGLILLGTALGCFFGASSGALIGIGTPEPAVKRYLAYVDDGGILLSVHVDNDEQSNRALNTLEAAGGEDITTTNEAKAWQTVFAQSRNMGMAH